MGNCVNTLATLGAETTPQSGKSASVHPLNVTNKESTGIVTMMGGDHTGKGDYHLQKERKHERPRIGAEIVGKDNVKESKGKVRVKLVISGKQLAQIVGMQGGDRQAALASLLAMNANITRHAKRRKRSWTPSLESIAEDYLQA